MQRIWAFALMVLWLMACRKKQEQTQPTLQPITEAVYASGIVKSVQQYQVYAATNGIVQKIWVTEGDLVKKGTPLMQINSGTAQLNNDNAQLAAQLAKVQQEKLAELKIDIAVAKSKLDNDELLLQKQKNLWQQGIGTQNELENRQLQYTNARNAFLAAEVKYKNLQQQLALQLQQAEKNVQLSQRVTSDFTVVSQTEGKVYNVYKKEGEMVTTQNPVALVGAANNFLLELQVDEYDIASIAMGQKVLVQMDSYKNKVFEALVSKINPSMNAATKSFTIEATFVQPPPKLYPNLTVEANIVLKVKNNALTIPRNYLTPDTCVLLPKNQKRKVVTGLKDYQKIEILEGLSANDVIVKPVL